MGVKLLLLGFGKSFREAVAGIPGAVIFSAPEADERYDIIALNERKRVSEHIINAKYMFCSQYSRHSSVAVDYIITCGMDGKCTLTFSSIGGDAAMLAVNREIISLNGSTIELQEVSFKTEKKLSVYENLVLGGIKIVTDNKTM